jgi:NAD(P)-dependent dehydrogenase (short-subunit alcohol dehydrogenase family)
MPPKSFRMLVTGGCGRLGGRLVTQLEERGHKAIAPGRRDVDWAIENEANGAVSKHNPSRIVACASFTNVAKADKERDICYKDTVLTARSTAKAADRHGAKMLYISTDYVVPLLRGENGGFYATCKRRAEEEVLSRGGSVVRVAFVTPEQVADWEWVNAYAMANRWWVEKAAEVLSRYASAATWPEVGSIGPLQATTCEDLLRARFPDHVALGDRVTTPKEMKRRVGFAAPSDSRFESLFII